MTSYKPKSKYFSQRKLPEPKKQKQVEYLLEQTDLHSLREAKKLSENLSKYHWQLYYELAQQREKIFDELKISLLANSKDNFEFAKWQRAVKWKFSDHPLCTVGSRTFIGGRFNYGDEINSQINGFNCLYLALDKDTALQETLGQSGSPVSGLSPREIALSNPASESVVSISGNIENVIDLRNKTSLKKFVDLIADFKTSPSLKDLSKLAGTSTELVTTPSLLLESLIDKDWRILPTQVQVPSNSQIFGQIVMASNIQGIIYQSKLTKKECMAIFTQNFEKSTSYVKFDDEQPETSRIPQTIDSSNFELTLKTHKEILKSYHESDMKKEK